MKRRHRLFVFFVSLALAGLLGGATQLHQQTAYADVPRLTYTLTQEAAPEPVWKIVIMGKGYQNPPQLRLNTWGGWGSYEGYYVRNLKTRPQARTFPQPGGRLEFADDADEMEWNGSFEVSYEIPVLRVESNVQERAALLPGFSGANSCGFAINTLMDVLPANGSSGEGKPESLVKIVPPPGASVASGWGGVTKGEQQIRFSGPLVNTPIVIGLPSQVRRENRDGIAYEVAQFGSGWDRTSEVLRTMQSVVPRYQKDIGFKPRRPVRVFLFDGASLNTHTLDAILLGYRATQNEFSAWKKQVVAHELFHDWLGGDGWIGGNEAIAWFHEGFTDYLSLWYAASTRVVDREWFAKRLEAIEASARGSAAYGKVAFADDGVRWRSNGYETLAYRGGAVLAFLTDVELRKRGQPGLMQMISDLGKSQRTQAITKEDIAAWMKTHNLTEFYERYYQGKGLPEIENSLKSIGFIVEEVEAELTYLGIRMDGDRVTELDPNGPAALAGVRTGDQVSGYFPMREERPRDIDQINTRFPYGLDLIEPSRSGTYLDIKRQGQPHFELPIQPRIIRGGHTKRYLAGGKALDQFFSFKPDH